MQPQPVYVVHGPMGPVATTISFSVLLSLLFGWGGGTVFHDAVGHVAWLWHLLWLTPAMWIWFLVMAFRSDESLWEGVSTFAARFAKSLLWYAIPLFVFLVYASGKKFGN